MFGIWYGKGPGVDRTGDVFRHANHAGTSKQRRRDRADGRRPHLRKLDLGAPVRVRLRRLHDAGAQSGRRAGDPRLRPPRLRAVALCRRLGRHQVRQGQHRIHRDRRRPHRPRRRSSCRPRTSSRCRRAASTSASAIRRSPRKRGCTTTSARAILAFARANGLDRHRHLRRARRQDRHHHHRQELSRYARRRSTSSASTRSRPTSWASASTRSRCPGRWSRKASSSFAEGLDLILVVEEKRSLIETQVKEQLYDLPQPARACSASERRETSASGCSRPRARSTRSISRVARRAPGPARPRRRGARGQAWRAASA